MTEVRRVAWPDYEGPEWSERQFLQGIAGTLELFHLSMVRFQNAVGEATGNPVVVYQRIDQAGQHLPLDERILGDTDTLMVFGLDHMITEQEASPEEIEAVRQFLTREGTCLIIGPHHDVGATTDIEQLQMEYAHHGDPLVPRQQRFGRYTRSLMEGLGVPVENRFGLRPALVEGTNQIAPLDGDAGSRPARVADRGARPSTSTRTCRITRSRGREGRSCAGAATDRSGEPASVHGGREPGIQLLSMDAGKRDPRGRYIAG